MDHGDAPKDSDFSVLKTMANILCKHGKTDAEIRKMLEYHFPITSAMIEKIMEARSKHAK